MCAAATEPCCKPGGFGFVLLQISNKLFRKVRKIVANQRIVCHHEIAGHDMSAYGGILSLILKLGT
jgi:hypothetical protein